MTEAKDINREKKAKRDGLMTLLCMAIMFTVPLIIMLGEFPPGGLLILLIVFICALGGATFFYEGVKAHRHHKNETNHD